MDSQFIDFKIIQKLEPEEVMTQCIGQNQKNIFLLYHQSDNGQLPFLKKILSAVQLDLDKDVLALEASHLTTFRITDIGKEQSLSKVIVFGFPPAHIGLQLQLTKYQAYNIGGYSYLFADSLQEIAGNKNLKGLLWNGLQEMFV